MRKVLFYLLRPFLKFQRYPDTSHGWEGVWQFGNYPLAFEDIDGLRFYKF